GLTSGRTPSYWILGKCTAFITSRGDGFRTPDALGASTAIDLMGTSPQPVQCSPKRTAATPTHAGQAKSMPARRRECSSPASRLNACYPPRLDIGSDRSRAVYPFRGTWRSRGSKKEISRIEAARRANALNTHQVETTSIVL